MKAVFKLVGEISGIEDKAQFVNYTECEVLESEGALRLEGVEEPIAFVTGFKELEDGNVVLELDRELNLESCEKYIYQTI